MAHEITQLSYKEGVFQYNGNRYATDKPVEVVIAPVMRADRENDDLLFLQITATYRSGESTFMKYGGVVVYKVDKWKELEKEKDALDYLKMGIWTQALLFFRGVLCEKLKGTPAANIFLPILPAEKIKEVTLQNS